MDSLPPQLSGEPLQELRTHLQAIIELRSEVKTLTKTGRSIYRLSDYVAMAYERIRTVSHGKRDRFYVPYSDAIALLQPLLDTPRNSLNLQFSTHKTTLVAALNQYVKSLQLGLRQSDSETGSTPPD